MPSIVESFALQALLVGVADYAGDEVDGKAEGGPFNSSKPASAGRQRSGARVSLVCRPLKRARKIGASVPTAEAVS